MISRLKSLELHGYKTFANLTLFEFPAEITAIVGPNGSGKSNISDSIRWVLGEQSFSLLRGRKTEDMIFSGSEQRPRSSMATSSITFNNEDGWLPIDFSEVSITRRAYRDGENEYLLNNQKVRLKDISELLSQSGLAQRTYTIIGQGLVDAALSLRPEERRRFFEEAAGIGLYRSRREESLNRLDATRRNMERVKDILSELVPRLQSLEKQAHRAFEYDRIKADLQLLLREWYGFHWHESQDKLVHAREVQSAQDLRLEQARSHLNSVEKTMEAERIKIQEIRNNLNQWHTESAGLHNQREKTSRSLAILEERQHSLNEQKHNLENDLAQLEVEQLARQKRSIELQKDQEQLETELIDSRLQSENAKKELDSRQNQRSQVENTIREKRNLLVSSEIRRAHLNAHLSEISSRKTNLIKSRDNLAHSFNIETKALEETQDRLNRISDKRDKLDTEYKQNEDKILEQNRKQKDIENRQMELRSQHSTLNANKARLCAQIDVMDQAEKSFMGLNQGARYVMEISQQGKITGKFKTLSSLIEVPLEYETAIAASLGEYLDGIIFDPQVDIEDTLVLLESGAKGRAVLLPQQLPAENHPLDLKLIGENFGPASELVNAPKEIFSTLKILLSQTIIVQDRSAARKLLPSLPPSARAVTLKGEIFWGSGVVIGGQDGRSGLVSRPRQKRELQSNLAQTESSLIELDQEIALIAKNLENHQRQAKDLQKELNNTGVDRSQAVQSFQKAQLDLAQAHQKSEFQKTQAANIEKQIIEAEEDTRRTSAEIEENVKNTGFLQEEIRDQNRILAGIPLEELQANLVQWNTRFAVIERASQDIKNRLDEFRVTLSNTANQKSSITQRMNIAASSLNQIELEKVKLQAEETTLNNSIEVLQIRIDPAEQALIKLDLEFNQIQSNQSASQQGYTVAERYFTQAQMEVSRQREALDSLRRRIEDDFGLVAFEYKTDILSPTPLPLEGMVASLPEVKTIAPEIEEAITRQRTQLRRIGAVNPEAKTEYLTVKERYEFLSGQMTDLKKADEDLRQVIGELDELMKKEFSKTFNAVAAEFKQMFTRLFGGGTARLLLVDEENPTESGVEIEARIPGRREQGLSLLSGGERSLTAVALIFSLLKVSPTPFCILDEVDAMLDEANVGRFCDLLKELSQTTQFIVITHNRNTVQSSAVIYGVTMGKDSVSQIISLKLDEVSDEMVRQP